MRQTVLLLTLLAFLIPFDTPAHPGMTDRYDGHKCFKKCEDWNILYGEYHLHDKDRKPIRVAKKPKPARHKKTETNEETVEAAVPPQTVPAPEVRQVVIVREKVVSLFDPLLLLLLLLLFLWLILRLNRRREETESEE